VSSSSGVGNPFASDAGLVDHVEVRMRGSSLSRRGSSVVPSLPGSGPGLSPAPFGKVAHVEEENVPFNSMFHPLQLALVHPF
jgi:hypothetical protein